MKILINDERGVGVGEESGLMSFKYAVCTKTEDKDVFKTVMPFLRCRDYVTTTYWAELYPSEESFLYSKYGFEYLTKTKGLTFDKTRIAVTMSPSMYKNFKTNKIFDEVYAYLGLPKYHVYKVEVHTDIPDDLYCTLLFVFPKVVHSSAALLSLITFLLRLNANNIYNITDTFYDLFNYNVENLASYQKDIYTLIQNKKNKDTIEYIINNWKECLPKLPLLGYEDENKIAEIPSGLVDKFNLFRLMQGHIGIFSLISAIYKYKHYGPDGVSIYHSTARKIIEAMKQEKKDAA